MLQLAVADLGEKVGLVLDRIGCRGKIQFPADLLDRCVVAGGDLVEGVSPFLFEIPELDKLVAHHVRVGSETLADSAQGVGHNAVPVFLVKRHGLERQSVFAGYQRAHLDVFIGRAVAFAVVAADAYVEQVQIMSLPVQNVDHNRAVDSS